MAEAQGQHRFFNNAEFSDMADRFARESLQSLGDIAKFQELLKGALKEHDSDWATLFLDTLRQQIDRFYDQQLRMIEASPMPAEAFIGFAGQMLSMAPSGSWFAGMMPSSPLSDAMLPKLGLFQDHQAKLEKTAQALKELRDAQAAFSDRLRAVALDSLMEFERCLKQLPEDHEASIRELYQIWLEASERCYEQHMADETYAQALGRLTTAGMRAQQESQQIMDDMLEAFQLPSKREMVSTQKRMNDIRRRQHDLAEQLEDTDLGALRREIAELRSQLDALKTS